MHAIRANFIASYSRARNLIQSDEPENPTILFSSTTSFFLFFPFFSLEKREREREIYQDSPLVSARRASLSARRYEEDVYDARRNFSLKLPTRYSSICAYQEVDNGVCYSERRGSLSTADFLSGAFDRRLSFVSHNKMGFNVRTKLENCSQQTCIYIYILGVFQLYVEVGEPCRLNRL